MDPKKTQRYLMLLLAALFFVGPRAGYSQQHDLAHLPHIRVTDLQGSKVPLPRTPDKPLIVIFLGPDCPVSQKYIPVIEDMKKSLGDSVTWAAVFPAYFSMDEIGNFARDFALTMPVFKDHDMTLIDLLQATITPEVFLISPDNTLLYKGAIDNWYYDLGRYRTTITQHYLGDAIASALHHTPVKVSSTEAIGCVIQQGYNKGEKKTAGKHDHHH